MIINLSTITPYHAITHVSIHVHTCFRGIHSTWCFQISWQVFFDESNLTVWSLKKTVKSSLDNPKTFAITWFWHNFLQSMSIQPNVQLILPILHILIPRFSSVHLHQTHQPPPPHVYLLLAVGGCVRIFSRQVLEMIAKATKGKSCFNLHLYVCVLAEQQHRTNLPHWISYSILAPQKTTKLPQGFQGDSEGNI